MEQCRILDRTVTMATINVLKKANVDGQARSLNVYTDGNRHLILNDTTFSMTQQWPVFTDLQTLKTKCGAATGVRCEV
jgi:hypothetical protein